MNRLVETLLVSLIIIFPILIILDLFSEYISVGTNSSYCPSGCIPTSDFIPLLIVGVIGEVISMAIYLDRQKKSI